MDEDIQYLGVNKSTYLLTLRKINLKPLINEMKKQFANWIKLKLPWFDRLPVIECKVAKIPIFFQNVITISSKIFFFGGKKPRVTILHQPLDLGGLAIPT